MRYRYRYLAVAPLLAAVVIAGCGGSSNPDTAKLQLPPSASQTRSFTPTTSTTTSTSTTPAITTPTSGPLSKEPTITAPSGPAPTKLETTDLVTGSGAVAKAGDSITVNYVGALYKNGKVFGSSWSSATTLPTQLANPPLIQGWVDGIPGMRVGGRRELILPPSLAYKNLTEPSIPPNSTLIFIVDLLGVTPSASTGATGG
jgi:peptidylprolyl isomerase